MNRKVIYLEQFKENIKIYIQSDFYEAVFAKTENLKIFPRMYPTIEKSKYRKIPFKKYIISYTIENNYIFVCDIFPTKSNYQSIFH